MTLLGYEKVGLPEFDVDVSGFLVHCLWAFLFSQAILIVAIA